MVNIFNILTGITLGTSSSNKGIRRQNPQEPEFLEQSRSCTRFDAAGSPQSGFDLHQHCLHLPHWNICPQGELCSYIEIQELEIGTSNKNQWLVT